MKKCVRCKKEVKGHGNSKYCSNECKVQHYKKIRKPYKETRPLEEKYVDNGYRCWMNIKSRCNNPRNKSYRYYGGRGIQCKLTLEDFQEIFFSTDKCHFCNQFIQDENRWLSNGRTLDRVDAAKDYTMDNCVICCRKCNSLRSLALRRKIKK